MPADLDGGFVVTPKDIYDEVKAVRTLVEPLPPRVAELEKDRDDHERRIRRLEAFAGRLSGVKGVMAIVASGCGAALLAHFIR